MTNMAGVRGTSEVQTTGRQTIHRIVHQISSTNKIVTSQSHGMDLQTTSKTALAELQRSSRLPSHPANTRCTGRPISDLAFLACDAHLQCNISAHTKKNKKPLPEAQYAASHH